MPVSDLHVGSSEVGDWRAAFRGRRVLVTGHTGFKGGWLSLWLHRLGAQVVGVALPAPAGPSFHGAVGIDGLVDGRIADIRCASSFAERVADVDADLLIHMAAQPLVRCSYEDPVETYSTNVVGTAVVLEAARRMPSLRGIVVVTSDKCYDNREWIWGYREGDPVGGADPYSSSKGCAELVAGAYRRSFFADAAGAALATVRAGNVFGGGDWSSDRLVPDLVKAALAGVPARIRNPHSIRPWQHVLEPLSGYLMLGARLLTDGQSCAEAWNFGPDPDGVADVGVLARTIARAWGPGGLDLTFDQVHEGPPEANILRLDSTKARTMLDWRPRLTLDDALVLTVQWYRAWAAGDDMRALSLAQIESYEAQEARPAAAPTVDDTILQKRLETCA